MSKEENVLIPILVTGTGSTGPTSVKIVNGRPTETRSMKENPQSKEYTFYPNMIVIEGISHQHS